MSALPTAPAAPSNAAMRKNAQTFLDWLADHPHIPAPANHSLRGGVTYTVSWHLTDYDDATQRAARDVLRALDPTAWEPRTLEESISLKQPAPWGEAVVFVSRYVRAPEERQLADLSGVGR